MAKRFHSISEVVAIVYCERQAVLDRQYGEERSLEVKAKAASGRFQHQRFAMEGKAQASRDRRCFVATAIYGAEAPETEWLRVWRDTVLMPRRIGRAIVRGYYALSPALVRIVERYPRLKTTVHRLLDNILRFLGRVP